MTTALDAALQAIKPTAPAIPTATKAHRESYRACVLLLAAGSPIPPACHGEFAEAVTLLGVTPDMLTADVAAVKEAARLHELASQRDALNDAARAAVQEAAAFEEEVVRQRAELLARKNDILGRLQVADNAAKKLANLERDNPRLAGG